MLATKDPFAFLDLMVDILRLPDEALATACIYFHKYHRFIRRPESRLDKDPLDDHTLALTTLHLTTLTLPSPYPRRISALLLPAWKLLHPSSPPLETSSSTYISLRATLLRSSLVVLRALGFHTAVSTPLHYTNRYLSRALEELEGPAAAAGIGVYEDDRSGPASSGLDHGEARGGRRGSRTDRSSRGQRSRDEPTVWESYSRADRLRLGVGHLSDTRLSKGVNESVLKALKNERLACQFPVRTVAAATVLLVLRDRGIFVENEEWEGWLRNISGERVNMEDFGDVVEIMEDNR